MKELQSIQRISGVLRYLLLFGAAVLGAAFALMVLVPDQQLVSLGDGQLNALRRSGAIGPQLMLAVAAPVVVLLALGVYWLQRLFHQYQQGHFFTGGNMRCYLWLVWLKAAAFLYGILWPPLLSSWLPGLDSADVQVTISAGALVELLVLLLIVHLLKAAQQIHEENKAFV
ncbi:MAG: hypothetical protein V2I26_07415 [Halieaceae bacterium]|jgi:hypothetical protein|nr:hypothetical protein [Halieaceae bacterium]